MKETLLKVTGVSKRFGSTVALNSFGFEIKRGEIHGLIGENGSGKSTICTIIAGLQHMDSGEMILKGEPYEPKDSSSAISKGVCMILQEKGTFDTLNVAKNIFIGKEELFRKNGLIDAKAMREQAAQILRKIHAEHIDPDALIGTLSFENKKLVEVARAMLTSPDLLIIDETSTALSTEGRTILYRIMEDMKAEDKAVIFISHDMDEFIARCDSLTVLRDGLYIDTVEKKDFQPSDLRRKMIGRELNDNFYRSDFDPHCGNTVTLSLHNVQFKAIRNINISLHQGEILGFGGLVDCGIHGIGRLMFGLDQADGGEVILHKNGKDIPIKNNFTAVRNGMSYMSKNRDQESLMVSSSVRDNVCLPSYRNISRGLFLRKKDEEKFVRDASDNLSIKMGSMDQYVAELSGGNKQKVVLAKWLARDPDIFIFDCPTRGIDIGVKAKLYSIMQELKQAGKSIVIISEEIQELIGMCDRIAIMKDGEITKEFSREQHITEAMLIEYMV